MSSISNIQQIVAVIRQQMATRISGNGLATARTFKNDTAQHKLPAKRDKGNLSALIGKRVQSIDQTDPDRGRKAFRIFLESVLLSEFGEWLINDPAFYRLVDEVHRQMEAEPEIAAAIENAVARLLSTIDNP